ncbi:hypothetical protein ABZY58_12185 [Micromonospora tulbaghiae]|uniref:hypothetical protein n=1 Tax=Micromonospora tulbaghiae TaxID=479978 RepID=UPI0033A398C9
MSTRTDSAEHDDTWMVQAAALAAPPLSADAVDTLRRHLAPSRAAVSPVTHRQQKKAA